MINNPVMLSVNNIFYWNIKTLSKCILKDSHLKKSLLSSLLLAAINQNQNF